MTYETYIFIPNSNRKRNQFMLIVLCILWIAAVVVFFLLDLANIAIFGTFIIGINYLKHKFPFESEKVSEGRLGNLPADKLMLSDISITFNGRKIPAWELRNVLIYADDHIGKSKGLFGESHGTDNRIEFELDDKKHSIRFQVRKKADLKLINDIAVKIENSTSTTGA